MAHHDAPFFNQDRGLQVARPLNGAPDLARRLLACAMFGLLAFFFAGLATGFAAVTISAAIGWAKLIWFYWQAGWNLDLPPPPYQVDGVGIIGSGPIQLFVLSPLMIVFIGMSAVSALLGVPRMLHMAKRSLYGDELALITGSGWVKAVIFSALVWIAILIFTFVASKRYTPQSLQHQPPALVRSHLGGGD